MKLVNGHDFCGFPITKSEVMSRIYDPLNGAGKKYIRWECRIVQRKTWMESSKWDGFQYIKKHVLHAVIEELVAPNDGQSFWYQVGVITTL